MRLSQWRPDAALFHFRTVMTDAADRNSAGQSQLLFQTDEAASMYLHLILLGVLLNAAAQLALKQGMRQVGYFDFVMHNIGHVFFAVAANVYIWAGLFCYVVSVAVWLLVLSRVEVSYAYPLLSIGYIVTACAGWLFFQENMSITRLMGILVVCFGVWLITRPT